MHETAYEDTVERYCWLLGPIGRARALRLTQRLPRAHPPRSPSPEGDSAGVDSCAEIAKETRFALRQLFRDRAAHADLSTLSGLEGDELGARGRGDRPRPERPGGRGWCCWNSRLARSSSAARLVSMDWRSRCLARRMASMRSFSARMASSCA